MYYLLDNWNALVQIVGYWAFNNWGIDVPNLYDPNQMVYAAEVGSPRFSQTIGGRLWNNLPPNIKTITSIFLFKQKLKTHLLYSLEKQE